MLVIHNNNYDITGNLEKLGHSLLLLPLITLLRKRKAKKLLCYGDFSSAYYSNQNLTSPFLQAAFEQFWTKVKLSLFEIGRKHNLDNFDGVNFIKNKIRSNCSLLTLVKIQYFTLWNNSKSKLMDARSKI